MEMTGDLSFDATSMGILGMIPTAGFALTGFLTLPLIRHHKLEHLLLASLLLALIGQLGRSAGTNVPVFLFLTLVAMVGLGLGNIVMPPLIMRYFPDRTGILASLYVTLLAVSTALAPQMAVPIASISNWRFSIGVWSCMSALAAIPWIILLARKRAPGRHEGSLSPSRPSSAPNFVRPWKSSIGWGLALVFAGCSSNTFATFAWLPAVLADRGMTPGDTGSMIALYAIVSLPTSLLVPLVVTKVQRPLPVAVCFTAMFAVGYAGILLAPASSAPFWVLAAGLGQGTYSFAFTMINKRTRTTAASASLSGFAQGIGYSLACLAPMFFGLLHKTAGSWTPSFVMLTGWLIVLTVGACLVNRPRMLEDAQYDGKPVRRFSVGQ